MNKKFLLLLIALPALPGCLGSRKCPVNRRTSNVIVTEQCCPEIPCEETCVEERDLNNSEVQEKEYNAYEEDENWQEEESVDLTDYQYSDYNDEETPEDQEEPTEEEQDQEPTEDLDEELDQDEQEEAFQEEESEEEQESRKEVLFELDGKKIKANQDEILNSNLGKIKQLALSGHKIVIESQKENSEAVSDYLVENGVDKDSIEVLAKNDVNELIKVSSYKEA